MSTVDSNNSRVLKNTIFLYLRMFITVVVALYTSRITLQYLGVTDYGLTNVVGGVISLFSFISVTMSNASTRFFSFCLGKNNFEDLVNTFKTTVTIYLVLIGLIFLIAESLGLWFVWNKLNIPEGRHTAAMIVYQISLLTLFSGLLRIPYNSSIIAHERMNFYAYTSIVEVVAKLLIVYLLTITPFDRMVFYNFMYLLVSILVTIWYAAYCKKRYKECVFAINRDLTKFKSIFSFAGWNFTSNMGDVAIDQGINILLNIFFGPAINAARAIAVQIKTQIQSFSWNFAIASSPQIIKLYASQQNEAMSRLVIQSSKLTFFLMFIMSVPLYIGMEMVLEIWLKDVPEWALIFARLSIINIVVASLGGTLNLLIQATGDIKKYVVILTVAKFSCFGLVYIAFEIMKLPPDYSFYVTILYAVIALTIQFGRTASIKGFDISSYLKEVVFKSVVISIFTIFSLYTIIVLVDAGTYGTNLLVMLISLVLSSLYIFIIGCNQEEKRWIRKSAHRMFLKIKS